MRRLIDEFRETMRKLLSIIGLLAIIAAPVAYAGIGFCRSMPCCPTQHGAHWIDAQQPDCCNTTSCAQAPPAASEYTSAKVHHVPLAYVAVLPITEAVILGSDEPGTFPAATSPPSLHRRIALLSTLLI